MFAILLFCFILWCLLPRTLGKPPWRKSPSKSVPEHALRPLLASSRKRPGKAGRGAIAFRLERPAAICYKFRPIISRCARDQIFS